MTNVYKSTTATMRVTYLNSGKRLFTTYANKTTSEKGAAAMRNLRNTGTD